MFRRKIGTNRKDVLSEDNVDLIDVDDLEEVTSVGESVFETGDEYRDKLSLRASEMRSKQSGVDSSLESVCSEHGTECVCDVCLKSFFQKSDDNVYMCPYCGHKFELDDLEEVDTMRDNPYKDVVISECRSEERRRRFQDLFQNRSETWQDGRKEQLSLELGSEEYGEYIDDLARNSPENQDDTFHDRLEQHNSNLVTKQYDTPDENPEVVDADDKVSEKTVLMQKRDEMQKRDIHAIAVRETIAAAALTESLTDDQLARAITSDNEVLYDPSVKPDEYVEALKDYVVGPSL